HALPHKLKPGNELPGNKEQTHRRGQQPQFTKPRNIGTRKPQARPLESEAATQKDPGIRPENPRQPHRDPHLAPVVKDKEGARQGHDEHQDGNHADGDSRGKSPRRRRPVPPILAAIAIIVVIAAVRRPASAATSARVLDGELDFWRCNGAWHMNRSCSLPFFSLYSSLLSNF